MQILRPNSTFRIVWLVPDPADSATYYPQVTIYSSLDGSVLAGPFNLAADGGGKYSYSWRVPGDATGNGTQIDQIVKVYTDAAHTVLSANYTQESRVYNIFDMLALARSGGGEGVDYRLVEKIVRKVIRDIPDYSPHFASLGGRLEEHGKMLGSAHKLVSGLGFGAMEAKFGEHTALLGAIMEALGKYSSENASIGAQTRADVMEAIQQLTLGVGEQIDALAGALESLMRLSEMHAEHISKIPGLHEALGTEISNVHATVRNLSRAFSGVETVTMKKARGISADMPEEKPKRDYEKLSKLLTA